VEWGGSGAHTRHGFEGATTLQEKNKDICTLYRAADAAAKGELCKGCCIRRAVQGLLHSASCARAAAFGELCKGCSIQGDINNYQITRSWASAVGRDCRARLQAESPRPRGGRKAKTLESCNQICTGHPAVAPGGGGVGCWPWR